MTLSMRLLDRFLARIVKRGHLVLIDHKGRTYRYGTSDGANPPVTIRLADARVPFDIVTDPSLGTGEAYMNGRLVIERGNALELADLFRSNSGWGSGVKRKSRLVSALKSVRSRTDRINWERRSRRNVAHHYDLSAALYELFLDEDRQYSCAYFTDPSNALEQAQLNKKAHIATKLHLKPGQRVLDIGCGWGGMALYLNRVADVDVLGITLSEEQLKYARKRAERAGVSDRVRFELIDYRQVPGQFDRIVSVGMFEHVGTPHYRTFFAKCRELLHDDGVMLLHTIGRMGGPGTTDAWTRKYIFPGGYNPALSEIIKASEQTRLIAADVETLRLHYAYTLDHWYRRTLAHRPEIEALYDERFFRMWEFYLAGALVAFRHGGMVNYQIQYLKRRDAVPITRDYLADAEQMLRALG